MRMGPSKSPRLLEKSLVGRTLEGRYRVLSPIASGGMGSVYRARQLTMGRNVALKALELRGRHAGIMEARFLAEATTLARVRHRNVVTVFDYGRTVDGLSYFAMELIDGPSLRDVIHVRGPLPTERMLKVACDLARGLREVHRRGLIHRDVKPSNVMLARQVDEEETVKLLDFGLVKDVATPPDEELTQVGEYVGSPMYMAPEQLMGQTLDARADVYAFGLCMFEMLTGRLPFPRAQPTDILLAKLAMKPTLLHGTGRPAALCNFVLRCMAAAPDDRPGSVDEVVAELERFTLQENRRREALERTPPGSFDWLRDLGA